MRPQVCFCCSSLNLSLAEPCKQSEWSITMRLKKLMIAGSETSCSVKAATSTTSVLFFFFIYTRAAWNPFTGGLVSTFLNLWISEQIIICCKATFKVVLLRAQFIFWPHRNCRAATLTVVIATVVSRDYDFTAHNFNFLSHNSGSSWGIKHPLYVFSSPVEMSFHIHATKELLTNLKTTKSQNISQISSFRWSA